VRALVLAACLAVPTTARPAPLAPEDLEAARIAWRYFERNYHPATGLVSSVERYPSTTAWDLGSSLLATVAARELGLLEEAPFDARISAALATLATQPLFRGELPNKAYDAATGRMTDYGNRPSPAGIGWSAMDVGRLASALQVVAALHPRHRPAVEVVVGRWRTCALAAKGELRGAVVRAPGEVALLQEGRLGYEQYAAHALAALGLDVSAARRFDRFAVAEEILGVRVLRDARDRRRFDAVDALATEPWVLHAFEHGLDGESAPLVRAIYDVQKRRWEASGRVTAMSEDHVDRPPWFVYGAIWADGEPWRTVGASGDDASELRALSTKAAFALATLFPADPYSAALRGAIASARDPERGWFAGVYERGGVNHALTANTNGVILEALLFKLRGPLLAGARRIALADPRACPPPPDGSARALPASLAGTGSSTLPPPAAPPAAARAPAAPRERRATLRLDGQLFTGWRGADRGLAGVVATLRPFGAAFLRAGVEATPFSPGGDARVLWGLGFDDWRPGTFFLTLDNWGTALRLEDEPAWKAAELTTGYKLPRLCLGRGACLAPLASVVAPLRGGPYLHGRLTFSLGEWFVMGGLGFTVPDVLEGPAGTPRWRVVYGFGRADWSPGGLVVSYHDWGPDSRSGNGILSVGVNWAL
jgi:hypothetical protein